MNRTKAEKNPKDADLEKDRMRYKACTIGDEMRSEMAAVKEAWSKKGSFSTYQVGLDLR